MATPKKKISRSRRNMRRFAAGKRAVHAAVTATTDGAQTRTHRITMAMVREGRQLEMTAKARKAAKA